MTSWLEWVATGLLLLIWLALTVYFGYTQIYPRWAAMRRPSSRKRRWFSRSKRTRGKRCPECGNLINAQKTICQHCGHEFGSAPAPKPPEAKPPAEKSSSTHHRKRGKYCPSCGRLIDAARAQCQHCNYVFFEARASAPPPIEPPSS